MSGIPVATLLCSNNLADNILPRLTYLLNQRYVPLSVGIWCYKFVLFEYCEHIFVVFNYITDVN